jgi:hypothetical protein
MSTIPSANTTPGYKYAVGTEFWSANRLVVCTVTKIASLSEFGADFMYNEKNYVVKFNTNNHAILSTIPITYRFTNTVNIFSDTGPPVITYNYVMEESDLDKLERICRK